MFRGRARRLHFVGIGGIGMSGIAEVLVTLGFDVRGSDMAESSATQRLRSLGVTVWLGHSAEHVAGADVVVTSAAVAVSNPEVAQARSSGIPVIPRAEMLAELMRLKYGIAIAGTHGKTTTTSLIATLLTHGGIDPTVVIGGRLKSIRSNARLGAGEYLVAEADESDGSFLSLVPTLAVVTNIDLDHVDHWRNGLDELIDAFKQFLERIPFYGMAVLCQDHPVVRGLIPALKKRHVTYGFSPEADYVAQNVVSHADAMSFDVRRKSEYLGRVRLNLIGRHNVQNALAALAVADEVGVDFSSSLEALASFGGIARRFELKGCVGDIRVVDDYGHHPQEVLVTLEAARAAYPKRRLVVAFQPHRFTRLKNLLTEFSKSFSACHVLVLADVYAAGETAVEGASSQVLVEQVCALGHQDASYAGSVAQVGQRLAAIARPGDLVLTLGAGNIWQAGEALLEALSKKERTASPT